MTLRELLKHVDADCGIDINDVYYWYNADTEDLENNDDMWTLEEIENCEVINWYFNCSRSPHLKIYIDTDEVV